MSLQNGTFTRTNGFTPEKDGILPRFFVESVENPIATQQQGHPVFFDQERVELLVPGNMLNVPVEIVNDSHRQRWPEAYKRFKDGQEMSADGTPLEMWPILKPAQVRELKAMNLFTIEHVANMSDLVGQRMMAGPKLRNLAKAYLDDAAAQAIVTAATAENEKLKLQVSELTEKVGNLAATCDKLFAELQAQRNAPNPIASYVQGQHDPMEQMRQQQAVPQVQGSSLDSLPDVAPRRRRGQTAQTEAAV